MKYLYKTRSAATGRFVWQTNNRPVQPSWAEDPDTNEVDIPFLDEVKSQIDNTRTDLGTIIKPVEGMTEIPSWMEETPQSHKGVSIPEGVDHKVFLKKQVPFLVKTLRINPHNQDAQKQLNAYLADNADIDILAYEYRPMTEDGEVVGQEIRLRNYNSDNSITKANLGNALLKLEKEGFLYVTIKDEDIKDKQVYGIKIQLKERLRGTRD